MRLDSFHVGAMECTVIVHGGGRGTPEWMFPQVPPHRLHRRMDRYLDRHGEFDFVYSSLLVRTGSSVALIDTSLPAAPDSTGPIEQALEAVGLEPLDVDVVVLTHGHLDHVGALSSSGAPSFPRARHHMHGDEVRYWTTGAEAGGAVAVQIDAVRRAGLLEQVERECEVLPGLQVIPTPGHTPGHVSVVLSSDGDHAIHAGDVLAHEVNVAEPGWNHFSDMDGKTAARSRRHLVERAFQLGALVAGSHLTTRVRAVAGESDHGPLLPSS